MMFIVKFLMKANLQKEQFILITEEKDMYKNDTIEELENYLETLGVYYQSIKDPYVAIGFRLDHFQPEEFKDVIHDLRIIAPLEEWVHQDKMIYSITHIDNVQFPLKLNKAIYEGTL